MLLFSMPIQNFSLIPSCNTPMHKLIYILKTLESFYQNKHWTAKGENFYSNHKLFGDLYNDVASVIDNAVELALVNRMSEALISAEVLFGEVIKYTKQYLGDVEEQFRLNVEKAIVVEKLLLNLIENLLSSSKAGLNNFLTGIAEQSNRRVYLLSQHLK